MHTEDVAEVITQEHRKFDKTWVRPIVSLFSAMSPRKRRSMVEFAEQELILATGVRRGERFSFQFAPWTRLLVSEMSSDKWRRFWLAGSVQSGKTLLGFILPTLYSLFELEEPVICGVPNMEIATGIWAEKILPAINSNPRLKKFLPTTGIGSRGAFSELIQFTNGATLRFSSAGGGSDAQMVSHSARIIVVSEADKMDTAGEASEETDPLRKCEARSVGFGDRALMFAECTLSTKEGRMHKEVNEYGTGSRIFIRCPHCNRYIYPVRSGLIGWSDAESEGVVRREARYICTACQGPWTELDRRKALEFPLLVHRGQEVDEAGNISGPVPDTRTFGLMFNVMHSPLVSLERIAVEEWRTQKDDTPDARKNITQHWWGEPYQDDSAVDQLQTTEYTLLGHVANKPEFTYKFGERPQVKEETFVMASADCQKKWLYWQVDMYRWDLTRYTLAWGVIDIVPREKQKTVEPTPQDVINALDVLYRVAKSFGSVRLWVDRGYKHEASTYPLIAKWLNKDPIFTVACIGKRDTEMPKKSEDDKMKVPGVDPSLITPRRQEDGGIIWFVNTSCLKDELHERLGRPMNISGCHWLPDGTADDKNKFILKHLVAEKRMIGWDARRGCQTRVWENKTGKENHMLDTSVYSLAGAKVWVANNREPVLQEAPVVQAVVQKPVQKRPNYYPRRQALGF